MHGHFFGCFHSQPNLITFHAKHSDFDLIANDQGLANFTCKNEHYPLPDLLVVVCELANAVLIIILKPLNRLLFLFVVVSE